MNPQPSPSLPTDRRIGFLRTCYWIGAAADLLAAAAMLFPQVTKAVFALPAAPHGNEYLYASRVGASLMLGWTFLLIWGSRRPVERRAVLFLTLVPVLVGLLSASALAVQSGFIRTSAMLPLWIFYALIIPLYVIASCVAAGVERSRLSDPPARS